VSEMAPPARRAAKTGAPLRYYCDLDRWSFDPRYTEGRCPICGWAPEGAPSAPKWLIRARRFEWELSGLVALLVVLVVLAAVVAHAAGYRIPILSGPAQSAPATAASPARAGKASPRPSPSPAKGSASPSAKH
jgi:hypothetical protein